MQHNHLMADTLIPPPPKSWMLGARRAVARTRGVGAPQEPRPSGSDTEAREWEAMRQQAQRTAPTLVPVNTQGRGRCCGVPMTGERCPRCGRYQD